MSVAVRHPETDPAARNRGAVLRQLAGRGGLGGLGSSVISTVSQKLGAEKERETLLAPNGLGMHHQHAQELGPRLAPELEPEPEAEPESAPEEVMPAAPAGSSRDDVFRDTMFAAYLNRVEEKGCAWRQELNRCGIVLTFDASPRTSASIAAARQLAGAAEARRDTPAATDGALQAAPAQPAVSRGKVMVRNNQHADWVSGEIVHIDEVSRLATVAYGANSTVRVLLTDPTRVRLVPPPQSPDAAASTSRSS